MYFVTLIALFDKRNSVRRIIDEINILADYRPGGLREYVFKFQAAILILLFTMVAWGLAGLDIFENLNCHSKLSMFYKAVKENQKSNR